MNPFSNDTQDVNLKLNKDQYQWLKNSSEFLTQETGCEVTPESVMMRLVQYGLPEFERELGKLRKRGNANREKVQRRLHLAYTRVEK